MMARMLSLSEARREFRLKLKRVDELSYVELCNLKQESIHDQAFTGLGAIEKALQPHLKERDGSIFRFKFRDKVRKTK
jgi:hypothetical protein